MASSQGKDIPIPALPQLPAPGTGVVFDSFHGVGSDKEH